MSFLYGKKHSRLIVNHFMACFYMMFSLYHYFTLSLYFIINQLLFSIFTRIKSVQRIAESSNAVQIIMFTGRPDFLQIKMTSSSELDILCCLFLCFFLLDTQKKDRNLYFNSYKQPVNQLSDCVICVRTKRKIKNFYLTFNTALFILYIRVSIAQFIKTAVIIL